MTGVKMRLLGATCATLMAASASAVTASAASASFIVYRCGVNLCKVNPDGSGQAALTSDGGGSNGNYSYPSLSTDGTHLSFIQGNSLYASDGSLGGRIQLVSQNVVFAYMKADGSKVAWIDNEVEGGGLVPYLNVINSDGSNQQLRQRRQVATSGWLGDGLLADTSAGSGSCATGSGQPCQAICLLVTGSYPCARTVAQDASRDLWQPQSSPDGTKLAAEASAGPHLSDMTIELFDPSTGSLIGDLTHGSADGDPAWSPDGKWVAFDRAGGVWVIPADGSAAPKKIAAGDEPTWGGSVQSTPSPTPTPGPSPSGCHVPKVVGKRLAAAERAVTAAGCSVGRIKKRHVSRRGKRGTVLAQSPKAGQTLAAGAKVSLTVGR